MNLAACSTLPRTPENGVWYRLIEPSHMSTALSSAHTKVALSRFNAGSVLRRADRYATLYFADDPLPAHFEVGALLGDPMPGGHMPHPRRSFVVLNVHVILREVVDLTDVATAHLPLQTNAQELTGDWRGYRSRGPYTPLSAPTGIAPTQELGRALFRTGVEAFRAISARVPWHKTLTVFVDNMQVGSSLSFRDPTGTIVHTIP